MLEKYQQGGPRMGSSSRCWKNTSKVVQGWGAVQTVLLAINMAIGFVRVLRGGSFLPQPDPQDDKTVQDRNGRWWRVAPDGSWEDAFRRIRKD
jgi:hypothetical protein